MANMVVQPRARTMPSAWMWPGPAAQHGAGKVIDFPGVPPDQARLARAATDARAALHEAAVAAAEAANRARAVAAALDQALAVLDSPGPGGTATRLPAPPRAIGTPASLSPREREVLALVAEGRTNKAIAEALYVSPNTVKTHVGSLLSKLHADTRAQLAAMAAEQQLV